MNTVALAMLLTAAAPAALAQSAPPPAPAQPTQAQSTRAVPPSSDPQPLADPTAAPQAETPGAEAPATPELDGEAQLAEPRILDPGARANVDAYPASFFASSRPNTALDMVGRLPGFSLDEGADVRGFAGTGGNVLIDGRQPASKSDSLANQLGRIPAANVERIEIIRGGAPGIDMGGRSLVANVVRKRADSFEQTATALTNWFVQRGTLIPGGSYTAARQAGETGWDLSLSRGTSFDDSVGGGRRVRRDASGALLSDERAGTEADGGGYSARGAYKRPLWGGELRANASASDFDFKDEDHFTGGPARIDSVGTSDDADGEAGLNFTRPLGARWSMEAVGLQKLGRSRFDSRLERGAGRRDFSSRATTGESIGRGVLRFRRSETLSFEGGAEAAFNFLEGQASLTEDGSAAPLPSADVRVEELRGEAFAQANWRPRPTLAVELGARFETSTIRQSGDAELERSFFYPKPRALLTWTPAPSRTYRLRLERELGQLDFDDFVSSASLTDERVAAGNPELEPPKTTVLEAVAEHRFWDKGAVTLTLRREAIADAIDRVLVRVRPDPDPGPDAPDIVFDAPGNIGEGTNAEIELEVTLPLDRLGVRGGELKADLEFRNSEVTDSTTGDLRRISGQRPDEIEFSFRQDLPERRLTWGAEYTDGFEERDFRFDEVSGFGLNRYFGLFAEYKPIPKLSLRVELNNLGRYTLTRRRAVYAGERDSSLLLFAETYPTRSQNRVFLRVRRTLG